MGSQFAIAAAANSGFAPSVSPSNAAGAPIFTGSAQKSQKRGLSSNPLTSNSSCMDAALSCNEISTQPLKISVRRGAAMSYCVFDLDVNLFMDFENTISKKRRKSKFEKRKKKTKTKFQKTNLNKKKRRI